MSKKWFLVIVALVIVGGAFVFTRQKKESPGHMVPQDQGARHGQLPEGVMAMDANNFSFQPSTIHAKVGEKVRLHVQSVGQHTLTVDELGVNISLSPVQVTRVEVTPDRKGTFTFYCATPGHREKGMIGTLKVE